ncbi:MULTISPECIES: enoyl-CoA hydratase-related protein [unclassified Nocardioides]|uniref:enoyl-CoA hydratase-related protein n=1 Tax=unclassified Nocardioides TaxID=2615069 RepID=UPI0006F62156|nr:MULTISPECIES: enoyl-CoA hydratase-related protein [unclassified Nocardioides]KQY57122.1 enoyl-CoA hydratase [Nocardioides sp. Root140]KQZ68630.1 enoyl-CoA hydratase [Nocardioides sp. Root151]
MNTREYADITYAVEERIATITLNRPQARNGYTLTMADELNDALNRADHNEDVRVVVLTGTGDHFCVGADLSGGGFDVNEEGSDAGAWQEPAGRCSKRVHTMDKPVIAAMRGAAVGAGVTITLACDFRLASTDSKFGFVFGRRGIFPEGGSAWYLPRLVGMTKAQDWMISGRVFGADEALSSGLVTSVHAPEDVLEAAYVVARDLRDNTAPVSVAVIRQMLNRLSGEATPFPAHEVDSRLIAGLPTNVDAIEGVMSFLEKRPPVFTNTVTKDLPEWLPWLDENATGQTAPGEHG